MKPSIFLVIASAGLLAVTITGSEFNIFAVPSFIISRHCKLMNKSEFSEQIQAIVRQKSEPLLDLSRVLLIVRFGTSHTDQESESLKETLKKYCQKDHPSWGNNTGEWMEAVKPCFQDDIYNKIILDQKSINSSLTAVCDNPSDVRWKMDDILWREGATNPEGLTFTNLISPVYIYAHCFIQEKINSTDQIMQIVYEKSQMVRELGKSLHQIIIGSSYKPTVPRIDSFLSNLWKYCRKHNPSFVNDYKHWLQAITPCYKERVNKFNMDFNNIGWSLEYACDNRDKLYEFLKNDGLDCAHRTNKEWFVCTNATRYDISNPCEIINHYWKISECAQRSLQNCQNPWGAELADYIHKKVSNMIPCDGKNNIELLA